jgi:hypothetical protein
MVIACCLSVKEKFPDVVKCLCLYYNKFTFVRQFLIRFDFPMTESNAAVQFLEACEQDRLPRLISGAFCSVRIFMVKFYRKSLIVKGNVPSQYAFNAIIHSFTTKS